LYENVTTPTLCEAVRRLADGDVTAVELLTHVESRADAYADALGTYLFRYGDVARAQAADVDRRRQRGDHLGPLAGVPLGVKDVIATADAPTTAQSRVSDASNTTTWGPDATVVERLRRADAVLTGKTSTLEFALAFNDEEKGFPLSRNPWHRDHWTGGSSSGTASGVAAGYFLGGLGSDTAGSIRMPSAWCGITGHMPTPGLVPTSGVIPLAWSYDRVGPMARTAEDCALMLSVLAGRNPSGSSGQGFDFTEVPRLELAGLRIGVARQALSGSTPEVQTLVRAAADIFDAAGAHVIEVDVPHYDEGNDTTMLGLSVEALSHHLPGLRSQWHDYSVPVRQALLGGALITASDYVQIQRVRHHLADEIRTVFDSLDLILSPTAGGPSPRLDTLDFAEAVSLLQTAYWNATGNPAVSVPMGRVDGLPVGLQIIGPVGGDTRILDAARLFQSLTHHHLLQPDLEGP
jgi:aspartyl-tRNA(Asn)/glutamyl-tRNA(Gln) amidotransferase subunit A